MPKPTLETYFANVDPMHQPVINHLRGLLQSCDLTECMKWQMPVYMAHGRNAVGLYAAKEYVGIWFYEGNRINDHLSVLVNAQEGKTKKMRHWKVTDPSKINDDQILDYIQQAIDIAANPIKEVKIVQPVQIPELLEGALSSDFELRASFEAFPKYKKKEFCEYIESAKRASTKQSRLQKIIPMIASGIGLGDKYRK